MDPAIVVIAGLAGLAWGYVSDRLGARWPAHDDGSIRQRDWRTVVVTVAGGAAAALLVARFGDDPLALVIVALYTAVLIVLFATDLDQRLLPNVLTYPLVVYAILVYAVGASPFLGSLEDLAWAAGAAVVVPVGLYLLAIPFGSGAIGEGDLKLLVSAALFAGISKLFYGLIVGAVAAGVIVGVLVFIRRLTMRSYVPYGPFLIAGMLWALLALPRP